jgi:hypothetical protein
MLDRILFALRILFAAKAPSPRAAVPSPIPDRSPLGQDPQATIARTAALSMLDEETYGFVLLTVRRVDPVMMRIEVQSALIDDWWPAMLETMERVRGAIGTDVTSR